MTRPVHDYLLHRRLSDGDTVYTAWSSVPDIGFVELLANGPFEAVTLDMQHGSHDENSVLNAVAFTARAGKPAVVRIPLDRFDMASRALDMGADAVIAPMINSMEDALAFRDAVKYPPLGKRSWGASRAIAVRGVSGGTPYLKSMNEYTVALAMIETREAYEIAGDIAGIAGIDGLFVGPSDFSIAWSGGEVVDPALPDMMDAVANIAKIANKAGKHAAIFAADPAMVPRYREMGFRFIAVGFDVAIVAEGQKAVLAKAGIGSAGSSKPGY